METVADALQGANDIIAELLSDDADLRKALRGLLSRQGHLRSVAVKEEDSVYRLYYDFRPAAAQAGGSPDPGRQPGRKGRLPLRDGAAGSGGGAVRAAHAQWSSPAPPAAAFVSAACEDAYDRLIYPSLEREARVYPDRYRQ